MRFPLHLTRTKQRKTANAMNIQSKDIDQVRAALRKAGATYEGIRGWFYFGRPVAIDLDASGNWFAVLPF